MASLSGCTVPIDAVAGISVSADGHLLGVMLVCGHHVDGATLSVDSDDARGQTDAGSWTAVHRLSAGLATWPLDSPSPGWPATVPPRRLTPGTRYALYGWTEDNSWSAGSVSFTPAGRDRLTPGDVRYDSASDTPRTVPMATFEAEGCRDM
ncbi:hypothetical protein [Actinacidiphila yeochonensis]|uniref:hypothetical protein n=1 Tax=Actinacidiphila yeochonensis TaxID=89050 RepID=UPI0006922BAB|nr:hypothetical protein [Actinacidiphila yeochonensis]